MCRRLLVAGCLIVTARVLMAGEPPTATNETRPTAAAKMIDDDHVERLIRGLAAADFATRERSAIELRDFGLAVLPKLRVAAATTGDAELRLRVNEIVRGLTENDLKARLEAFLAGEDVPLEGWRFLSTRVLPDSGESRSLFVEMYRSYPKLMSSLQDGTSRDRAVALRTVITGINNRMVVQREFPTVGDTFALLIPAIDPGVPVDTVYDAKVLSVMRQKSANEIRRHNQFAGPFKRLLAIWMMRSNLSSRIDVLRLAMDWEVKDSIGLAAETLDQSDAPETLAVAMQAIAQFGLPRHVDLLAEQLNDRRAVGADGFNGTSLVRTQVRDVAMAAIATLRGVDLKAIGMKNARQHPRYGFLLTQIGFPLDADDGGRDQALRRIGELLRKGDRPGDDRPGDGQPDDGDADTG